MILLKNYSKSIYVARGHTSPYKRHFKGLGFRWSKSLKGGPAYTVKVHNMKHINTIYEKLKHIVNSKGDDVCLIHTDKFKKRLASTYNPEDQNYPNKKICDGVSDESEIDSFKEAFYLAITSFPIQLVLFSMYFNYVYPHSIISEFTKISSSFNFTDFFQSSSFNVTDFLFHLQDKIAFSYQNVSDNFEDFTTSYF